jgi:tetratricopeptide (TPR) repeat protein
MPSLGQPSRRRSFALAAAAVLGAVTLAYSNHFENSFFLDDFHTVQDNVYIRYLGNIPRFFTDSTTFSAVPENRSWRPLVTTSLAIDYWLGGGFQSTFYFHLSTFLWFLLQLLLMYGLYRLLLERIRPQPLNFWIAWFAVAWYGLHPAIAETVNYIIQRGDLLSTLGVVAALFVYVRFPARRKHGLYLIPFVLGVLAKPPALIFPLILAAYLFLFEESFSMRGIGTALWKSVPATALALALAKLSSAMTSVSFVQTREYAYRYLITQPYVALRYFGSFFLPTRLSADSDLTAFTSLLRPEALAGFLFLAALLWAVYATARRPHTRPISFGLLWFLLALAPTSLFPLSDVENDHRMFFPFVGLVLAVTWAGSLLLERRPFRTHPRWTASALGCLLLLCALGTRARNEVWRTEESLWLDVTAKSPRNGRALMGYGAILMDRGDSAAALPYFERAEALLPADPRVQLNLGVANGELGHDAEAERHFRRAIQPHPKDSDPYFGYARWLNSRARAGEAVAALNIALSLNPSAMGARYLLLRVYAEHGLWGPLKSFAEECLKLAPDDPGVLSYLRMGQQVFAQVAAAEAQARSQPTPESYLQLSTAYHKTGRFQDCIAAAQQALRLRPDFAQAYNNMAAAYASLGQWDQAILAAREALRIQPDFQFARNNLEFALSQKSQAGAPK